MRSVYDLNISQNSKIRKAMVPNLVVPAVTKAHQGLLVVGTSNPTYQFLTLLKKRRNSD